ncbi:MAG: hypothetical protein JSS57_01375 [Proteobacteria bacterium]|nr:hypothetical protein [Pseudomonadota bacterium]
MAIKDAVIKLSAWKKSHRKGHEPVPPPYHALRKQAWCGFAPDHPLQPAEQRRQPTTPSHA